MSDQFNLYPDTKATKDAMLRRLQAAYVDRASRPMFTVMTLENTLTVTLRHNDEISEDSRCYFPACEGGEVFRYGNLIYNTGQVKSGCHDVSPMYGSIMAGCLGYVKYIMSLLPDASPSL